MKRTIAFILALSMALSLVACGGDNSGKTPNAETGSQPSGSTNEAIASSNASNKEIEDLINSITAENAEATGLCGADLTWYYKNNVLVIKGTGAITEYNALNEDLAPWNDYKDEISRIIVDEGCTELCDGLIIDYKSLASIIFPDSLTKINDNMVSHNPQLVSVKLGKNIVSIGDSAFLDCIKLETIQLPEGLTSIGVGAFDSCTSLSSIQIPSTVNRIGERAFIRCRKFKEFIFPEGITTIEQNVLSNCDNLTYIEIPSTTTEIEGGAFSGNYNITDLNIKSSSFVFEDGAILNKDKTVLVMYLSSNNSTSYSIPEGVTEIVDHAFEECEYLEQIDVQNSVKTIGSWAFGYCTSLKSLVIPESVEFIGYGIFFNCESLSTITFMGNAPGVDSPDLDPLEDVLGLRDYYSRDGIDVYYSGDGFDIFVRSFPKLNWIKQ